MVRGQDTKPRPIKGKIGPKVHNRHDQEGRRGSEEAVPAPSVFPLGVSLPLGLALGSPIFPSDCEGKLGVALESLQGLRDLT